MEEGHVEEMSLSVFLTHLITRASSLFSQSMLFTVPLNKLQQRVPII